LTGVASNGGLACDYIERLWGQDNIEEERRLAAIDIIKKSIDNGIAAVSWDISGCEWGLIIGYDDETQTLYTLKINGSEDTVPYEKLGKIDLPLLSVLTVTGITDKAENEIINGTLKIAAQHLDGEEWCDNAKGIAAYPALIDFIRDKYTSGISWNLDYYLGTYASLKLYAYKYFNKYGLRDLAEHYKIIYESWLSAFRAKTGGDATDENVKNDIITYLNAAYKEEKQALELMKIQLV